MEEINEKISIKDVSVKWGLISAVIAIVIMLIGMVTELQSESWYSIVGIIPTIIFFVMAHNQFKNEGDGFMSYGEGLKIGMLVTLVSSLISTAFFYVYIKFIDTNFITAIREKQMESMMESGMPEDQIDQAMKMGESFSTPEVMAVFGIVGALFFGFIIALIVSAFTKNSNPEFDV